MPGRPPSSTSCKCFSFWKHKQEKHVTVRTCYLFHYQGFNLVHCVLSSLTKEAVQTSPTIGSNVEEIAVKKTRFLVWDIGGQESLRASWNSYYCNTEVCVIKASCLCDRKYVKFSWLFFPYCLEADTVYYYQLYSLYKRYNFSLNVTDCHPGGRQHWSRTPDCY